MIDADEMCSEVKFSRLNSRGEAAVSQHENPNRTSKLPSVRVVLLVLGSLLAAALIIIYRLSSVMLETNRSCQTLKEENEALRKNLSAFDVLTNQTVQTLKEENEALRRNLLDLTCLKCKEGWEQHGGTCYYFSTIKFSWDDSRHSCKALGGDLVKIDSRDEQMFLETRLRDMMENDEEKFWIGLTFSEEVYRWSWVDGSPLTESSSQSFWTNQGLECRVGSNCVKMGKKGGTDDLKTWFFASCTYPQKSICEKAAGLS